MQLKGTQKRMIAIKTNDSQLFEEAYFVLKPNIDNNNTDMVAEAEKIIRSRVSEKDKKPQKWFSYKNAVTATVSFLLGAAVCALIFLVL